MTKSTQIRNDKPKEISRPKTSKFSIKDIVLVKTIGYPPWPSIIKCVKSDDIFRVHFIGVKSYADAKTCQLEIFNQRVANNLIRDYPKNQKLKRSVADALQKMQNRANDKNSINHKSSQGSSLKGNQLKQKTISIAHSKVKKITKSTRSEKIKQKQVNNSYQQSNSQQLSQESESNQDDFRGSKSFSHPPPNIYNAPGKLKKIIGTTNFEHKPVQIVRKFTNKTKKEKQQQQQNSDQQLPIYEEDSEQINNKKDRTKNKYQQIQYSSQIKVQRQTITKLAQQKQKQSQIVVVKQKTSPQVILRTKSKRIAQRTNVSAFIHKPQNQTHLKPIQQSKMDHMIQIQGQQNIFIQQSHQNIQTNQQTLTNQNKQIHPKTQKQSKKQPNKNDRIQQKQDKKSSLTKKQLIHQKQYQIQKEILKKIQRQKKIQQEKIHQQALIKQRQLQLNQKQRQQLNQNQIQLKRIRQQQRQRQRQKFRKQREILQRQVQENRIKQQNLFKKQLNRPRKRLNLKTPIHYQSIQQQQQVSGSLFQFPQLSSPLSSQSCQKNPFTSYLIHKDLYESNIKMIKNQISVQIKFKPINQEYISYQTTMNNIYQKSILRIKHLNVEKDIDRESQILNQYYIHSQEHKQPQDHIERQDYIEYHTSGRQKIQAQHHIQAEHHISGQYHIQDQQQVHGYKEVDDRMQLQDSAYINKQSYNNKQQKDSRNEQNYHLNKQNYHKNQYYQDPLILYNDLIVNSDYITIDQQQGQQTKQGKPNYKQRHYQVVNKINTIILQQQSAENISSQQVQVLQQGQLIQQGLVQQGLVQQQGCLQQQGQIQQPSKDHFWLLMFEKHSLINYYWKQYQKKSLQYNYSKSKLDQLSIPQLFQLLLEDSQEEKQLSNIIQQPFDIKKRIQSLSNNQLNKINHYWNNMLSNSSERINVNEKNYNAKGINSGNHSIKVLTRQQLQFEKKWQKTYIYKMNVICGQIQKHYKKPKAKKQKSSFPQISMYLFSSPSSYQQNSSNSSYNQNSPNQQDKPTLNKIRSYKVHRLKKNTQNYMKEYQGIWIGQYGYRSNIQRKFSNLQTKRFAAQLKATILAFNQKLMNFKYTKQEKQLTPSQVTIAYFVIYFNILPINILISQNVIIEVISLVKNYFNEQKSYPKRLLLTIIQQMKLKSCSKHNSSQKSSQFSLTLNLLNQVYTQRNNSFFSYQKIQLFYSLLIQFKRVIKNIILTEEFVDKSINPQIQQMYMKQKETKEEVQQKKLKKDKMEQIEFVRKYQNRIYSMFQQIDQITRLFWNTKHQLISIQSQSQYSHYQ